MGKDQGFKKETMRAMIAFSTEETMYQNSFEKRPHFYTRFFYI